MAAVTVDSGSLLLPGFYKSHKDPSGRLSSRDVQEILERKIGHKDFRLANWSIKPLGETHGFMGLYFYVYATVKLENRVRNFRFFAKTPPAENSLQHDFLTRFDSFNKEIMAYTDILAGMKYGSGPKWKVDCYLYRRDEVMVLDDATYDGYVMPDKYVPLDYDHCVCMLGAFARFHAGSIVLDEKLREKGSNLYELYGHLLGEVLFAADDERSTKALKASVYGICAMVDLIDALNAEQKARAKEVVSKWAPRVVQMLQSSDRYRNVICHRDCWANNLMVKRDSMGKPVGFYLIDFQFLRYCPPAIDFTFCLYLTTSRAIRDLHFDAFMEIYHDNMKQALADEGLDIATCLPWNEFRESCLNTRRTALIYALLNVQMMLLKSDVLEQTLFGCSERLEKIFYTNERGNFIREQFLSGEAYRERNTEIILEALETLPND